MSEQKNHPPSPRKLRRARERGELPHSRALTSALTLLAVWATFRVFGAGALADLRAAFELAFRAAAADRGQPAAVVATLTEGLRLGALAAAPILAVVVVVAAGATFVQLGPVFAFRRVAPDWTRLDPAAGAKRIFGVRGVVELLWSVARVAVILALVAGVAASAAGGVAALVARGPAAALQAFAAVSDAALWRVALALVALGALDLAYQRWRFLRDQRMTREEVEREHKEDEGDPHAKQERARLRKEIVEHGVLEAVRRADVLVVNPTHYAVALQYDDAAGDEAPEVIAKGQDHLARRMIDAAREAGVPVMRDVPLAHALYDLELGDLIPEPLYDAVAAVLQAAWAESAEAPPTDAPPEAPTDE